ncbi:unnamed protein product [Pleuronectes platessa]|uniref:Uncharacterized protein n=1 Tax=Pleuronectes platessa TaxID=8262 RepID=A0A9N7VVM7_PLEPL|nr:unnamed protein product [Pleuronectes platessa]
MGRPSAVIVVKKELSCRAKLSINQWIYAHKLWGSHLKYRDLEVVVGASSPEASWASMEVYSAFPIRRRPEGTPRSQWRDYLYHLALGTPRDAQAKAGNSLNWKSPRSTLAECSTRVCCDVPTFLDSIPNTGTAHRLGQEC